MSGVKMSGKWRQFIKDSWTEQEDWTNLQDLREKRINKKAGARKENQLCYATILERTIVILIKQLFIISMRNT